ncbi:twin-arginine translocase TatA/TatE family subunit [Rhodanobacter aciditrophus]|uniref:twin-arginine translocase TatA/TatE family subunit n=1 Tax=Rhodanobacter aciditrophus TaxID=1623218 RepID=UPI003CEB3728
MFGLDSVSHWIVLLVLVLLVFGTGKLRNAGRDIGHAVAEFRKGVKGDERPTESIGSEPDVDRRGSGRQ